MKLFEYVNQEEFIEMVKQGYITVNSHDNGAGYKIINYSKICQAEKVWNDTTEKCRGIIVDSQNNIIARPFKKFYNFEEHEATSIAKYIDSNIPFEVYEKLDGSLGILWWLGDTPFIATKGSFHSDQARHATQLLHTRYRDIWDRLDKNKTYLFEIIYPEDLHVVTYKDVNDIFLIGVLDLNEDKEYDVEEYSDIFRTVKKYEGITSWMSLREDIDGDNREGFVIKFADGFRLKLKYADYWTLHFLKAGFSEKNIFKALKDGDNEYIENTMKMFDEEHQLYYLNIINKYTLAYNKILNTAMEEFVQKDGFATRKEAAEFYKQCTYPAVMFKLYDKQNVSPAVWRHVEREVKFANED